MKTLRGFGFTQRADSKVSHIVADSVVASEILLCQCEILRKQTRGNP